jgi:hypothetical protein
MSQMPQPKEPRNYNRIAALSTLGASVVSVFALIVAFAGAFFQREIIEWRLGEQVDFKLSRNLSVGHRLGVVWLEPYLQINNVGGKEMAIGNAKLWMVDTTKKFNLELEGTALGVADRAEIRPNYGVDLRLRGGQQWSEKVAFKEPLSEAEDDEWKKLMSAVQESQIVVPSLAFLGKATGRIHGQKSADEISALEAKATDFFKKTFKLKPGHYKLFAALFDDKNRIIAKKAYEFYVAPYVVEALSKQVGSKSYFGIAFGSDLLTEVTLKPLNDPAEIETFFARLIKP